MIRVLAVILALIALAMIGQAFAAVDPIPSLEPPPAQAAPRTCQTVNNVLIIARDTAEKYGANIAYGLAVSGNTTQLTFVIEGDNKALQFLFVDGCMVADRILPIE